MSCASFIFLHKNFQDIRHSKTIITKHFMLITSIFTKAYIFVKLIKYNRTHE